MNDRYAEHYRRFQWTIPAIFNIGEAVLSGKDPQAVAVWDVAEDLTARRYTFGELAQDARRLANVYQSLGIGPGDRVGILLSQSIEL
ncbi:AMP-binding protein, partial [Methylacidiphilum caldifontis]|uniref:AMP-binding protein n=1 Tax=Methylacidiphilum caldifontis TaxID=2795386 RepID=UPI001068E41D